MKQEGKTGSVFRNETGSTQIWKAVFEGECREMYLDGRKAAFENGRDSAGKPISFLFTEVMPMQEIKIQAVRWEK